MHQAIRENLVAPSRPPGFPLLWAGTRIPFPRGTALPIGRRPELPAPCGELPHSGHSACPVCARLTHTSQPLPCAVASSVLTLTSPSWSPVRSQLRCHLCEYLLSEVGHCQPVTVFCFLLPVSPSCDRVGLTCLPNDPLGLFAVCFPPRERTLHGREASVCCSMPSAWRIVGAYVLSG